jgi:hypothetical protein
MTFRLTAKQVANLLEVRALHGEQEKLADVIQRFLLINPKPSDQQFHALAESLGVDKETLEAIAYQLLGEYEQGKKPAADDAEHTLIQSNEAEEIADEGIENLDHDLQRINELHPYDPEEITPEALDELLDEEGEMIRALTQDEEILEGEEDPATTPADKVMLNDGDPQYQGDPGFQEELFDDGVASTDIGVGLDGDQAILNDDGVTRPRFTSEAALRLKVHASLKKL